MARGAALALQAQLARRAEQARPVRRLAAERTALAAKDAAMAPSERVTKSYRWVALVPKLAAFLGQPAARLLLAA